MQADATAGAAVAAASTRPPDVPSTPPPLLILADVGSDAWIGDLVAAAQAGRRVLMVYDALDPATPLTQPLLASLERAYSALGAAGCPTADAVPVVPATFAKGWSLAALAARLGSGGGGAPPPGAVVVPAGETGGRDRAAAVADALAAAGGPRPDLVPSGQAAAVRPPPPPSPSPSPSPHPLPPPASFPYPRAAVGGTFDRLHAGHRLLLAASALAARDSLFIGVTDGALIAQKAGRAPLQPYAVRAAAAAAFARSVRPEGLVVETAPLTDPAAPTAAETDPAIGALVVSAETVPGGEAIALGRAGRGIPPLDLVVVGLVGAVGGRGKVSSTALRDAEGGDV